MDDLLSWQGRTEQQQDLISSAPMRSLAATLDRDDPAPQAGDLLPPLWHWLYFLPVARQSELGADGHPRRGGFLPPVPLPRRMWAGGRLRWHQPLHAGETANRLSTIQSVQSKSGRSGELVFVTVRHEISGPCGLCITEEQDLVYRADPQPGDAPPAGKKAQAIAAWERELVPDAALLMRYSALTFNAHRIHYDRGYATDVEGYPGLVVHGPLLATLLADLARRHEPLRPLSSFEFRALRPAIEGERLRICGAPGEEGALELWTVNPQGDMTMQVRATLAAPAR